MPQEPAALLSSAGLPASRGVKSALPAATEGEGGGGLNSRFGEALRESQAALNESATGNTEMGGGNIPPSESLPGTGMDLPPEVAMITLAESGAAAGASLDEDAAGASEALLIDADDVTLTEAERIPVEPEIDVREIPDDTGGAIPSVQPAVVVPAGTAPVPVENGRPGGLAPGQERQIEVALAGRTGDGPVVTRANPVPDDGGSLLREQFVAGRDRVLEDARRTQNFSEELTTRVAAEGAGRFVNVSGMAVAEVSQQVSPLSSPQAALQPAGDKAAAVTVLPMETPLQAREWKEEFGDRVRWLITQKMHTAELKINPPQLGAIEIRINVQNDQVSVQFQAAHAMVRDALEDSLPRLREILNSSGLDLVDVDVAQHSQTGGREADNELGEENGGAMKDRMLSQDETDEAPLETNVILRQGMVDIYA